MCRGAFRPPLVPTASEQQQDGVNPTCRLIYAPPVCPSPVPAPPQLQRGGVHPTCLPVDPLPSPSTSWGSVHLTRRPIHLFSHHQTMTGIGGAHPSFLMSMEDKGNVPLVLLTISCFASGEWGVLPPSFACRFSTAFVILKFNTFFFPFIA